MDTLGFSLNFVKTKLEKMAKAGKLLIVDDNRNILAAVRLLCDSIFEEVITLPSPNTLITTLQKSAPEVVLLDMNFHAGINTGNEGSSGSRRFCRSHPKPKWYSLPLMPILIWRYGL